LQGASLSPVQAYATEILLVLDERELQRRQVFDLRSRLVAAHPEHASEIFPDWFVKKIDKEEAKRDPELEWSLPASQQEADELDAWVREHQQMTMTGEDLGEWQ